MSTTITSRRNFLKGSASAAGILVVPMAAASRSTATLSDSIEERAQKAYLEAVLHKHTGRSRKLNAKQVRLFAQRFTEEYGVVDYKTLYSGIAGEYRLTRLFVRSTKLAVQSA